MTNALTETSTIDPFARYAAITSSRGTLLRFNKGDWVIGADADPVKAGAEFVAVMREIQIGLQKWEGGKPTVPVLGRLVDNFVPPPRASLGDLDPTLWETGSDGKSHDPWQQTNIIPMIERATGEVFSFVASADGGFRAVGNLCAEYSQEARIRPGPCLYPVIQLAVGGYKHRSYGRIKNA
jgi:hypothetical protein